MSDISNVNKDEANGFACNTASETGVGIMKNINGRQHEVAVSGRKIIW